MEPEFLLIVGAFVGTAFSAAGAVLAFLAERAAVLSRRRRSAEQTSSKNVHIVFDGDNSSINLGSLSASEADRIVKALSDLRRQDDP
ncbi:MAG TPA: hypothetical protein VN408_28435 [Actinoplanes sp.]|nr:hypothetical protein [Actinoplanes sp.]